MPAKDEMPSTAGFAVFRPAGGERRVSQGQDGGSRHGQQGAAHHDQGPRDCSAPGILGAVKFQPAKLNVFGLVHQLLPVDPFGRSRAGEACLYQAIWTVVRRDPCVTGKSDKTPWLTKRRTPGEYRIKRSRRCGRWSPRARRAGLS